MIGIETVDLLKFRWYALYTGQLRSRGEGGYPLYPDHFFMALYNEELMIAAKQCS